jgi:DNA-binding transcriptional ArsR family regulator
MLIPDIHKLDAVALQFKALGEVSRLEILNALSAHQRLNVSALAALTQLKQANLSKHLSILLAANLVHRKKEGKDVYYALADAKIQALCLLAYNRV